MWSIKIPSHAASAIGAKLRPAVERATKAAMPRVAALVIDHVSIEADKKLQTTAGQFKAAFQQPGAVTLTDTGVAIAFTDPFALALEKGFQAFDIKAKMLAKARKFTKGGSPYVDVPFQHAAVGESRMQALPAEVRFAMNTAVARAQTEARKAGATREEVATQTVRLPRKTPGRKFTRTLMFGSSAVETSVEHKRGIHDDLLRTAVMGSKRAISSYKTIRRISANSAATSWWHPGFKGVGVFVTIIPRLRREIEAIIRDAYRAAGLPVRFR